MPGIQQTTKSVLKAREGANRQLTAKKNASNKYLQMTQLGGCDRESPSDTFHWRVKDDHLLRGDIN